MGNKTIRLCLLDIIAQDIVSTEGNKSYIVLHRLNNLYDICANEEDPENELCNKVKNLMVDGKQNPLTKEVIKSDDKLKAKDLVQSLKKYIIDTRKDEEEKELKNISKSNINYV